MNNFNYLNEGVKFSKKATSLRIFTTISLTLLYNSTPPDYFFECQKTYSTKYLKMNTKCKYVCNVMYTCILIE